MNSNSVEIGIDGDLAVSLRRLFDDPGFFDRLSDVERRRLEADMDTALAGLVHNLTA